MRTALNGIFADAALPISTTGTFASSIPSVVPNTTAASDANFAARMTVATCVLSPISAMKNAATVTPKTPQRVAGGGTSASSLSGLSAHRATREKGQGDEPPQDFGRHERANEVAEESRERVVGEGGGEDAQDDRHRLSKARGEHEREQLRLVADLAERNHACRDEKGFHGNR